ncbi:hypothetical protein Arad_7645 [Rhizobium rhizogenes K84]|uniref:Uncharacterized protein n=1 Tax=Rhizobium rhizogenes (strain K84 / ATCC BAA-868) TaxID=311403 RepID=B9JNH1_RHIR8|nr:hypothetical protein Arad_7645 [Rhizobium rhizogenes K84]
MSASPSTGRWHQIDPTLPLILATGASGKKLPASIYVEQDIARPRRASPSDIPYAMRSFPGATSCENNFYKITRQQKDWSF